MTDISEISQVSLHRMEEAVDKERLEEIQQIRVPEERKRRLVSAFVIKDLLSKKIKTATSNIKLTENIFGKKSCENNQDIHFNISHSGNWIVVGFGISEIGIDVEKMEEIDLSGVASFFTKEEQLFLTADRKNRLIDFYKIWTAKESYMKYTGLGFNMDLDSFIVPFTNKGKIQKKSIKNFEGPDVMTFPFANHYCLSICSEKIDEINWIYNKY